MAPLVAVEPAQHRPLGSLARSTRRLGRVHHRQRGELHRHIGMITPASSVRLHFVQPAMPVARQEVLDCDIAVGSVSERGQGIGRVDAGQAVLTGVEVEDGLRRTTGQPFRQPRRDLSLRRRQAGPQREIGLQDALGPRL